MTNWKKYKLSELAKPKLGLVDGPFGSNLPASDYTIVGIPVIRGTNLSLGLQKFNDNGFVFVSPETAKRLERSACKAGDIIFTKKGTLGQIGIIPTNSKYNTYILSSNQMKFSVDENKADKNFIYYYLSSQESISKIKRESESTGVPKINLGYLKNFEITIPENISTQTRIASILSALDDKIELNRRTNHTLEQMAQTLFKKYFVTDIDPDNLPEGWRWGKLSEEFNITMGQSPEGSTYNESKMGVPFFQGRTDFNFRFPSFRIYTTSPKRFAKKFDILLSVRAPVGDLNLSLVDCCIGRGLASLRHKDECLSYGFCKLQNLKEVFGPYNGEGTVFGSINKEALEKISVLIPSKEKVQSFEKTATLLDAKIHALFHETNSLIQIRDSLLPKLMSGEITVN